MATATTRSQYHRRSAALASDAFRKVRGRSPAQAAAATVQLQRDSAVLAVDYGARLLDETALDTRGALVLPEAFTADPGDLTELYGKAGNQHLLQQLASNLVADAGRSAMGAYTASRDEEYGTVRVLSGSSCGRCAILAGKFYRWSDGFQRHPRCDCQNAPCARSDAHRFVQDPNELALSGKVHGLSEAQMQAVRDGGDLSQIVNAQRGVRMVNFAGRRIQVTKAGAARYGNMRLTPETIYRVSDGDRELALALLERNGYVSGARAVVPTRGPTLRGGAGGGARPPRPPAGAGAAGEDDDLAAAVARVTRTARDMEPAATAHVVESGRITNGTVERLASRLKTESSIAEKLTRFGTKARDIARQERRINDALRYTLTYADADYWTGVRDLISALTRDGFTVTKPALSQLGWRKTGYAGINLTVRDPAGNLLEVQAHTAASLAMAERNHDLYERIRNLRPGPERQRLQDKLDELFASVPLPPGVPRVD